VYNVVAPLGATTEICCAWTAMMAIQSATPAKNILFMIVFVI
jgi:hypothetical protein